VATGPNAPALVGHATWLLTDKTAYRSMATAGNPYVDAMPPSGSWSGSVITSLRAIWLPPFAFSQH
jgi:hypothetical protein